ncbi:MAG: hypothetical protein IPM35_18275 [Myxococcales bacterium]|nr:hypothetical protein [Myxococcales bacterium]
MANEPKTPSPGTGLTDAHKLILDPAIETLQEAIAAAVDAGANIEEIGKYLSAQISGAAQGANPAEVAATARRLDVSERELKILSEQAGSSGRLLKPADVATYAAIRKEIRGKSA